MSPPSSKKRKQSEADGMEDKDSVIEDLRKESEELKSKVAALQDIVALQNNSSTTFYASPYTSIAPSKRFSNGIPQNGLPARFAKEMIQTAHLVDFSPQLNTSSYVNVVSEPEEREVANMGAEVNLADGSVYPASVKIHDRVVNWVAKLWNAPEPATPGGNYCGAGTVGSTEACLLAGLALKFRWRNWYKSKHKLTDAEVEAIKPNLVISTCYQAAWEKFFRYFDADAKFSKPNLVNDNMAVNAKDLVAQCDEKTIGVVCILGNHYNGAYDPVWEVDAELKKLNKEKGWQVGIHVDGASGGFIAPFQTSELPPYDFRLDSVLTMSASGHKFGESICGTGWVIFRERQDLAEHIAVSVTYLGGKSDSMTLNFSRPASGPYVQYYKMLRLGKDGYVQKVKNQMKVAKYLRDFLKALKHSTGKSMFQILDGGDENCLPVVAARLNPELGLSYDDIDLQHALSESHWYVSGYSLGFENFTKSGELDFLCSDADSTATMFRIVVKSNLTMSLAEDLVQHIPSTLAILDGMQDGYRSIKSSKSSFLAEANVDVETEKVSMETALITVMACNKWRKKAKHAQAHNKQKSLLHSVC